MPYVDIVQGIIYRQLFAIGVSVQKKSKFKIINTYPLI